MGTMKFEIPHTLNKDQARQRVEQLLAYWKSKYGVQSNWSGDGAKVSGKVMGISLDANFTITDGVIQGEGTDPGMLLRGKAKSYIQDKFSSVLDSSKSIDDVNKGLA
ncbi:MAG: polyhydroxyalkanoic acid system family protein [Cystobacter sp.]